MNKLLGVVKKWPKVIVLVFLVLIVVSCVMTLVFISSSTPSKEWNLEENEDYLRGVIHNYKVTKDVEQARESYNLLPDKLAEETLLALMEAPGDLEQIDIVDFYDEVVATIAQEEIGEEISSTGELGLWVCIGVIFLLLAGLVFFVIRWVMKRTGVLLKPLQEGILEEPSELEVELEDILAEFNTTYRLGDDLYDDSFPIEDETGIYLGECSVNIPQGGYNLPKGQTRPRLVYALAVCLYDIEDRPTVTNVLMSRYFFENESDRNRLARRGEPVMMDSDVKVELHTTSLKLNAKVLELEYVKGEPSPESVFERVKLELEVRKLP